MNFLHTFYPNPILITIGPLTVFWYGLFVALGLLTGSMVVLWLAKKYGLSQFLIYDMIFYLIIASIIGARLYDVLLNIPYYIEQPLAILKIWQGGLAIHGAIIFGLGTLYWFTKKHQLDYWLLASLIATGGILAQAIGRWGNYFNQELFGLPTGLPWGIPIDVAHRPIEFITSQYFHPTFLYESLGNLVIFAFLLITQHWIVKNHELIDKKVTGYRFQVSVGLYLIGYSILRFFLEFIRIDATPTLFRLRFPQIVSLIIIFGSLALLLWLYRRQGLKKI